MPLVSMYSVTDNDIFSNQSCIFIYADNRKRSGEPTINNIFRNLDNAYPVILKKHGGDEAASYWKDEDIEVFRNEFDHSMDDINSLLRRRAVGILCRESLDHDTFSFLNIKDHSKLIHDYALHKIDCFYSNFTPNLPRIPTQ